MNSLSRELRKIKNSFANKRRNSSNSTNILSQNSSAKDKKGGPYA
jgi:hypothetical protein